MLTSFHKNLIKVQFIVVSDLFGGEIMISRVLKFQIFTLFFLVASSLIAFYMAESFPDNYMSISSSSNDFSALSYFIFSYMVSINYYIGPWIIFPFILSVIAYASLFSSRNYRFDLFFPFLAGIIFLGPIHLLNPALMGSGLNYLLKQYFLPYELLVISSLIFVMSLFASLRKSPRQIYFSIISYVKKSINIVFVIFNFSSTRFMCCLSAITNSKKSEWMRLFIREKLRGKAQMDIRAGGLIKPEASVISNPTIFSLNSDSELQMSDSSFYKQDELDKNHHIQKVIVSESANTVVGDEDIMINEGHDLEKLKKIAEYKQRRRASLSIDQNSLMDCITIDGAKKQNSSPDLSYFREIIHSIESKLEEFNIHAKIINTIKGPVVDTFELELGPGVKVSKVQSITQDLSLALLGAPIRIVHPMKGRPTMGIEVPRNPRDIIYLDEILRGYSEKMNLFRLPLAMGKDAFGVPFVVDLAQMPHMLVAGETGSGKSVFLHSLLVSMLIKKSPDQLKIILIDPKQLEMVPYAKLPHLILPVITDSKKSSLALMWVCEEMERRYTILKELSVRGIEGFNEKIQEANPAMLARIREYYPDDFDENYQLPFIVVVVDEFADLILNKNGKDIENSIIRLAQKARASGIHLVVTTQRPSTDVITGLIKANFPTRVSLKVAANYDSKTILGCSGAEYLLGKGDMIYKNGVEMSRVHSAYVSVKEVEALVEKLGVIESSFNESAMIYLETGGQPIDEYGSSFSGSVFNVTNDKDPLYEEAVSMVCQMRTASASMLQRRFKIGYNRAANLVDVLEKNGIIGPAEGSKKREVLIQNNV